MKPRMTDVVLPPTFEQTASFTPGPWAVHPDAPFEIVQNDGDVCPLVAAVIAEGCDEEQAKADARLIAAAPDLLAKLVEIRKWMDADLCGPWDAKFIADIDALVAAAKGGAA